MNELLYWFVAAVAAVGLLAELAMTARGGWAYRRYLSTLALVCLSFVSAVVLAAHLNVLTGLVVVLSLYRTLNILRANEDRWRELYLRRAVRRTTLLLTAAQLLLLVINASMVERSLELKPILLGLGVAQLLAALVVLASAVRNMIRSTPKPNAQHLSDKELPSVSVCIPARNETEDLQACLQTIIASDYPKLEILVLDDCSRDRTPQIIKDFAQDGVRFIEGDEPREHWLAKNQAYDTLLDQASGELVLFCGVDVRMSTNTIRVLATTLLTRKKDMASVLPKRFSGGLQVALIQPMRYWWEMALPRRIFNRPPVLSTLWIIRKSAAKRMGLFESVQGAIVPEATPARELVRKDAYSFLRSTDFFKLETIKRMPEQRDTAIRMRYPQVKKRPELIALVALTELALLLVPFVLLIGGFWWDIGQAQWLAGVTAVLLVATHTLIVTITNPSNSLLSVVTLPLAVLADIYVAHLSMLKYEFSTVDWKGRNICLPVLQAIPGLPPLPPKEERE